MFGIYMVPDYFTLSLCILNKVLIFPTSLMYRFDIEFRKKVE